MLILLALFGFFLINILLAYMVIFLVVGYNLRPRFKKDLLYERYINDEISTEEYIKELDVQWKNKTHAPLSKG